MVLGKCAGIKVRQKTADVLYTCFRCLDEHFLLGECGFDFVRHTLRFFLTALNLTGWGFVFGGSLCGGISFKGSSHC